MSWDQYVKEREGRWDRLVSEIGVNVGDFVSVAGRNRDSWYEVARSHLSTDPKDRSGMICVYDGSERSDIKWAHQVCHIHRKDDPWDWKEVGLLYRKGESFTSWPDPARGHKMIPPEFMYHGTYTIKHWLWYYCNKPVEGKKAPPPEEFEKLAGVPTTGVPWDKVGEYMKKLKDTRIRGWNGAWQLQAEQTFGKSINIIKLFEEKERERHVALQQPQTA